MLRQISRTRRSEKGFTLIEMVVVLGVIALLAAILTPMMLTYLDESKRTKAEGDVQQLAKAIVKLAKDVDHFPAYKNGTETAGPATISLLCSNGNLPILATGVNGWTGLGATSTPCAVSTDVDKLENHLVKNTPGGGGAGTTPYASGPRGRVWQGPYLEKIPEDPWGNAYVVNIVNAPANSAGQERWVLVISGGSDGQINTPGNTAAASGLAVVGDDIAIRLK